MIHCPQVHYARIRRGNSRVCGLLQGLLLTAWCSFANDLLRAHLSSYLECSRAKRQMPFSSHLIPQLLRNTESKQSKPLDPQ